MTEELKKLQKEINGKVIWWRSNEGNLLHAICIWPPNGDGISVKAYGHTPEEIHKVEHWTPIVAIKRPSHCLTGIKVSANIRMENGRNIEDLANVPDGCVYDSFKDFNGLNNPTCPYGA